MYLISVSDFQREYSFPNVNEVYSDQANVLNMFIDNKVRLLLKEALGLALFTDLDSYIQDGELIQTAPTKWKNLVNGVTYTKSGKDYRWSGLRDEQGSYINSLLVKFVFCEKLRAEQTINSGVGEVALKGTNSINITSNYRLVNSWNKFIEEYQGLDYKSSYPFIGTHRCAVYMDWLGENNNSNYVNLLRFLRDNPIDYPNPRCKVYPLMNTFGL